MAETWFHVVGGRWHLKRGKPDSAYWMRRCNTAAGIYGPAGVDGVSNDPPQAERCQHCCVRLRVEEVEGKE